MNPGVCRHVALARCRGERDIPALDAHRGAVKPVHVERAFPGLREASRRHGADRRRPACRHLHRAVQRGDIRRGACAGFVDRQIVGVVAEPFAGEVLLHLHALGVGKRVGVDDVLRYAHAAVQALDGVHSVMEASAERIAVNHACRCRVVRVRMKIQKLHVSAEIGITHVDLPAVQVEAAIPHGGNGVRGIQDDRPCDVDGIFAAVERSAPRGVVQRIRQPPSAASKHRSAALGWILHEEHGLDTAYRLAPHELLRVPVVRRSRNICDAHVLVGHVAAVRVGGAYCGVDVRAEHRLAFTAVVPARHVVDTGVWVGGELYGFGLGRIHPERRMPHDLRRHVPEDKRAVFRFSVHDNGIFQLCAVRERDAGEVDRRTVLAFLHRNPAAADRHAAGRRELGYADS